MNSRKVLGAVLDSFGVPVEQFAPVCVVVDKLDKIGPDEVRAAPSAAALAGANLLPATPALFLLPPPPAQVDVGLPLAAPRATANRSPRHGPSLPHRMPS